MTLDCNDDWRLTEADLLDAGVRLDCGCVPCAGQCRGPETLSLLWREAMTERWRRG